MSSARIQQVVSGALLILILCGNASLVVPVAPAQEAGPEEFSRKVKVKVPPVYPEVARRLSITGSVKVAVVVSPSGTVKSTKIIGGHPILVNAAVEALKKWRFETAQGESSGVVEIKFAPQD